MLAGSAWPARLRAARDPAGRPRQVRPVRRDQRITTSRHGERRLVTAQARRCQRGSW